MYLVGEEIDKYAIHLVLMEDKLEEKRIKVWEEGVYHLGGQGRPLLGGYIRAEGQNPPGTQQVRTTPVQWVYECRAVRHMEGPSLSAIPKSQTWFFNRRIILLLSFN